MNIEKKVRYFMEEVGQICTKSGRELKDILVIGASKSQELISIESARLGGISHFGENFLQEAEPKISTLSPNLSWHFIGSIQSRKAKKISSLFQWVQTVDRLKVAKKLDEHRPGKYGKLNICVQVNAECEESKSGISLEDCEEFISELTQLRKLKVRGLMAIPRAYNDHKQQREVFAKIRSKFEELKIIFPRLDTLSMGMSGDYRAAILEGTTMLRIGTGIFGERK